MYKDFFSEQFDKWALKICIVILSLIFLGFIGGLIK